MTTRLPALLVMAVALAACGSGGGEATTTSSAVTTTSTMAATTTTATTVPSTTTTETPTTTADMPGEPTDFGPGQGDVLAVIGVRHDDVLNLRAAPGVDQVILDGIPPRDHELIASGETRELSGSFWILVDYQGTGGWVDLAFVAYLGATSDETAAIIEELGGRPTADSMVGLGTLVAATMASDEPPSHIVMTEAPAIGNVGEVVFDVVGIGDDAVRGFRLHVLGDPVPGGFGLRNVEMTLLCGRGVTDDGLCL